MGRHSISNDASGQTWEPRPREGRIGRRSLAARMQEDTARDTTSVPAATDRTDTHSTNAVQEEATRATSFDTPVSLPHEENADRDDVAVAVASEDAAPQKKSNDAASQDSLTPSQENSTPLKTSTPVKEATGHTPTVPSNGKQAAAIAPKAATKASKKKKPSLFIRMIGVLGEIFITLGVMIGLFIVWQVWWTDILAGREQDERLQQVTQSWQPPATGIGTKRYDEPPAVDHNTSMGAYEGVMRIPVFGKDYKHTIQYGVSLEEVLDKGAYGHYDETAWPGEIGNFALAAHRQTYGAPMKNVDKLSAGSPIIVETKDAYLVYYVTESYITVPSDSEVISPVPNRPEIAPTERLLTITTCHPPFVSNERWIIHAKLDHWVARSDGIPEELAEEK